MKGLDGYAPGIARVPYAPASIEVAGSRLRLGSVTRDTDGVRALFIEGWTERRGMAGAGLSTRMPDDPQMRSRVPKWDAGPTPSFVIGGFA